MKNLFRPLLVLTGCIVLASCVSQKQFKGLKTDYTKLQKEYQESQLQLRENQARSTSLEERLAEAQRNNSELRKSLSDMQSILNKSLTQSSQGNMNMGKLIDEINASNRFIQHLVKEKNRSDSLNLVMVNKLTRSLTREEMRDLDIKVLKGVVYISLADNMLYKSGSYEISNKAEAVLSKIAKIIQDYKDYDVLVEGNTDTDPISRTNIRDIKVLKGVVYISLADNMLYKSGSYEISNKAEAVLSKIAKIIQDYKDYDVLVEGNTDTDPISRTNIRNNWDLSALRASSVVQALQNIYGINPKRLTAAGRGEFNPVAGNDTAEGKARNRRTEIIITPKLDQFMDLIDQAPDNSSSGIVGDENTKE